MVVHSLCISLLLNNTVRYCLINTAIYPEYSGISIDTNTVNATSIPYSQIQNPCIFYLDTSGNTEGLKPNSSHGFNILHCVQLLLIVYSQIGLYFVKSATM